MRPHLLLLALSALCLAATASATPLEGAWGLGARVFNFGGGEVSLLHGVSDRTAWLFDVSADQRDEAEKVTDVSGVDPPATRNSGSVSFEAGPRLRRFTRPDADFTPYWDVYVHGTRSHYRSRYSSSLAQTDDAWGVTGGLALGLEYFTRWHCSLAVHTTVAEVGWVRLSGENSGTGYQAETRGHRQTASLGLDPSLVLRVYF